MREDIVRWPSAIGLEASGRRRRSAGSFLHLESKAFGALAEALGVTPDAYLDEQGNEKPKGKIVGITFIILAAACVVIAIQQRRSRVRSFTCLALSLLFFLCWLVMREV